MVEDTEEWEKMDASEIHAQGLNVKQVLIRKDGELFIFPVSDGTVKLTGRGLIFRRFSSFRTDLHKPKSTTKFFNDSRTFATLHSST